ncbi:MAG: hypothetical protein NVS3B2_04540 [Ramlibacter sp.]
MSTTTQDAPARSITDLRGVGKQVAREAGGSTIAAFFEANRGAIEAVLPKHITPDRMLKIALRALRTTPKLMLCTVDSLFGAVITAAQLGLEPNTPQGHLYFIPFENRKKGTHEVQVITGYKGLVDLARRSGEIVSISSRVVYQGDLFELEYGTEERIKHVPKLDGAAGAVLGIYAVAKLQGGGTQFEFMTLPQIERIRNESQGYKTAQRYGRADSVWHLHFEQMGRKTLIRRLCNYLPMSIELAGALDLDDRAERGELQHMNKVLDGVDYTELAEQQQDSEDQDEGEQTEAEAAPVREAKPAHAPRARREPAPQAEAPPEDEHAPGPTIEHGTHDPRPRRASC